MTISNRNKKNKRNGSILASVMVAAIVWIMIAQSMFITFSGQFKMISSSRTALQAQQYAEIALDKLKNINYDELDASGAHGRKKIEGISSADWQDEVTIGAESTIAGSDDAKQRIATVNVYKVGDTLPRYTVELPLSSQGSSMKFITGENQYGKYIQYGKNGIILQYGHISNVKEKIVSIQFPKKFKNSSYTFLRTTNFNSINTDLNYPYIGETEFLGIRTDTSINIYNGEGGTSFDWIAIGY